MMPRQLIFAVFVCFLLFTGCAYHTDPLYGEPTPPVEDTTYQQTTDAPGGGKVLRESDW